MGSRDPAPSPSRRRFLDWFVGATGVAWLATLVYPVLRYLAPLPGRGAGGPIAVGPEALAEVRGKQGYTILRGSGTRVLLFADPRQELRALSAVCTHEGCTVQYRPGDQIVWCACHDGRFSVDGTVISGPPPRPLPRYRVVQGPEDAISVQLEAP